MLPISVASAIVMVAFGFSSFGEDQQVRLRGEYRDIDVSRETQAIDIFVTGSEESQSRIASRIEREPSHYAPAVFFHLAAYLHRQGKTDDALFWLYCGRIRTYFDIQRCADRSVAGAAEILNETVPPLLRLEQFVDLEKSKRIMKAAVQWDRDTRHDYDARWIALHGIKASLPVADGEVAGSLTIPESQWASLAENHREEYLSQWLQDVSSITDEQMAQILAKHRELSAWQE